MTTRCSEADAVASALRIVDERLVHQSARPFLERGLQTHGPLVPDGGGVVVPPYGNAHSLALVRDERVLYWKVKREPAVHTWRVRRWIYRIVDVLVELCGEVASEAVDLALRCFHSKCELRVALQRAFGIAWQELEVFIVWVRQVAEREDLLGFLSARIRRVVDLDDVGQLEGIQLLRERNAPSDSLLRVELDLIPQNLARQRQHLVGVAPRHVDATRLQVVLRGYEALRRELVVSKGSEQL